jgi:flagella basal body P-ring formation protein FlgA
MKLALDNLKVLAAVLVVLCVARQSQAAIDVKLRERVAPRGSVVRVGDVADIVTADRQQARQLAALPLMPAPAPGTEQFLRTREIQDMLSAQGVDLALLHFGGAGQVTVAAADAPQNTSGVIQASAEERIAGRVAPMNRHAAILAAATGEQSAAPQLAAPPVGDLRAKEIREQVVSIISNYLNAKTGKVQAWKIDCELVAREVEQLNAALSTPSCSGGTDPFAGRERFVLSFSTAKGQVQMPLFVDVTPPPMPAVVAIRPIGRGEIVKAADIELRTIDANTKSAGQHVVADSVERLLGMEARQAIQPGEIVYTDSVQPRIVVRRGDMITVVSQSGGIRVRTTGRATQDAAKGELVQVESVGTREKYDARVTGTREAAVYAIARPESPQPMKRADTARRPSMFLNGATHTTNR